jgi:hypothetical protein
MKLIFDSGNIHKQVDCDPNELYAVGSLLTNDFIVKSRPPAAYPFLEIEPFGAYFRIRSSEDVAAEFGGMEKIITDETLLIIGEKQLPVRLSTKDYTLQIVK